MEGYNLPPLFKKPFTLLNSDLIYIYIYIYIYGLRFLMGKLKSNQNRAASPVGHKLHNLSMHRGASAIAQAQRGKAAGRVTPSRRLRKGAEEQDLTTGRELNFTAP